MFKIKQEKIKYIKLNLNCKDNKAVCHPIPSCLSLIEKLTFLILIFLKMVKEVQSTTTQKDYLNAHFVTSPRIITSQARDFFIKDLVSESIIIRVDQRSP